MKHTPKQKNGAMIIASVTPESEKGGVKSVAPTRLTASGLGVSSER